MKLIGSSLVMAAILCAVSMPSFAANNWVGYGSADRAKPQHRPPVRPQPPRPHYPQRPSHPWGYPPAQNGVSIQYQAPTTVYHNATSYSWVNGDPNAARIESSNSVLITDWRRLGLPQPPSGMHWILENGRYVLVEN